MSKAIPYIVKRLQADNIGDIERLYRAVYGRKIPAGYFARKYDTAYTGVRYMGYFAYNEAGIPIAFYGVIPCLVQHGKTNILTAQSADTMTHPGYRNRGLFVHLAELTFQLCRDNSIRFVFGFPNQNSLPGFVNKLGWHVEETMDCFVIPVNRYNWERLFNRLPVIRGLYQLYTDRILKKHLVTQQGLNNSALCEGFDGVCRSDDHLKYKTYNTTKVIKANRALIWLKISNGLVIGDMSLATDNFNTVMRTLLRLARKTGVKQIIFQASPGTRLHRLFNDRYWSAPSFPIIFKQLNGRTPLTRIKFTTADIDTF